MTIPVGTKFTADTSGFVGGVSGATSALGSFQGGLGAATGALTVFAGASGLALAVDKALEFRQSLLEMNTLVGLSKSEIDAMGESFLGMAREVGQTPQELSNAMFAITSGGARGAEAMETLEQSAKAASLGLGNMREIGRTATAALQAFGSQGLTATEAIDAMVATVRTGNLEAEELAGAYGKVMGVAAQMGVTFQDLSAFVATFTRLGVNARVATTSLRATLGALMRPTEDARAAFEEIGIPIDEMRAKIVDDGLVSALREMMEATGGNIDMIARVIPQIRGLAGVLGTAGVQGEQFEDIARQINESLGTTNEGFQTLKEEGTLAFEEFGAAAEAALVEIGQEILPTVTDAIELLTDNIDGIIDAFKILMGLGIARTLVGIGAAFKGAAGAAVMFRGAVAFLGGPWGAALTAAGAALAGIVVHLDNAAVAAEEAREETARFKDELADLGVETQIAQLAASGRVTATQMRNLREELSKLDAYEQKESHIRKLRDLEEDYAERVQDLTDRQREQNGVLSGEAADALASYEIVLAAIRQRLDEIDVPVEIDIYTDEMQLERNIVAAERMAAELTAQVDNIVMSFDEAADAAAGLDLESIFAVPDFSDETQAGQELIKILRERYRLQTTTYAERIRQSAAYVQARDEEREAIEEILGLLDEGSEKSDHFMRVADRMAGRFTDAFADIVTGTESVAEAFARMAQQIAQDLARLAIQRAVIEPLLEGIAGGAGGGAFGAHVNAGEPVWVGELGKKELFIPDVGGRIEPNPSGTAGSQTIVQQNITFAPNLIDGRDAKRFFKQNEGEIRKMMVRSVSESKEMSRRL